MSLHTDWALIYCLRTSISGIGNRCVVITKMFNCYRLYNFKFQMTELTLDEQGQSKVEK